MSSQPSPCERLAQSRERLRQAMQQEFGSGTRGNEKDNFLASLLGNLQTGSGASVVGSVLQAWWRKQPLGVALLLADETAKVLLQPVARSHPYALVLGAAAAGGLVVLARPWRWISTPALLADLLPQALTEIRPYLRPPPRSRHDNARP